MTCINGGVFVVVITLLLGASSFAQDMPRCIVNQHYGPESVWYCRSLDHANDLDALAEQVLASVQVGMQISTAVAVRYDRAAASLAIEDCEREIVFYTLTDAAEIVTRTLRFIPAGEGGLDCRGLSLGQDIGGTCTGIVERVAFVPALLSVSQDGPMSPGYVRLDACEVELVPESER